MSHHSHLGRFHPENATTLSGKTAKVPKDISKWLFGNEPDRTCAPLVLSPSVSSGILVTTLAKDYIEGKLFLQRGVSSVSLLFVLVNPAPGVRQNSPVVQGLQKMYFCLPLGQYFHHQHGDAVRLLPPFCFLLLFFQTASTKNPVLSLSVC
jgi:hypothetical protein